MLRFAYFAMTELAHLTCRLWAHLSWSRDCSQKALVDLQKHLARSLATRFTKCCGMRFFQHDPHNNDSPDTTFPFQASQDGDRILLLVNHEGWLDMFVVLTLVTQRFPNHHLAFLFSETLLSSLPKPWRTLTNAVHIGIQLRNGDKAGTDHVERTLARVKNQLMALQSTIAQHILVVFPEGNLQHLPNSEPFIVPGMDAPSTLLMRPRPTATFAILQSGRFDQVLDMSIYYPETMREGHARRAWHVHWSDMLKWDRYARVVYWSLRDRSEELLWPQDDLDLFKASLNTVWHSKLSLLRQLAIHSSWWVSLVQQTDNQSPEYFDIIH